ncbi:MAG: hypothetical protein ACR2RD_02985 [Woeseiaceae bacterium]
MPYELRFNKSIPVDDPEDYWNECCWGGDRVSDHLLPMIRSNYQKIQHDQEDWGWFIWFRQGRTKLAVDVFCEDPKTGTYRIFLTSQVKRLVSGYHIVDADELIGLKSKVRKELEGWVEGDIVETLLDKNHDPVDA